MRKDHSSTPHGKVCLNTEGQAECLEVDTGPKGNLVCSLQVGSNQKIQWRSEQGLCQEKLLRQWFEAVFFSGQQIWSLERGVLFKSCLAPIAEFFNADC